MPSPHSRPAKMSVKNAKYFAGRVIAFYRGNYQNDGMRGIARVTKALALRLVAKWVVRIGKQDKYCPCCGWRGSRFLPFLATGYMTFDDRCPVCESSPRHRGHRIFYEKTLGFSNRSGCLLYFAPEYNLAYFKENPKLDTRTSQYPDGDSDYHLDILDMSFEDETWDYIVCHRVIEHLSDDRAGMLALLRILKPGGMAVLSVPITSQRQVTIEYGAPNPLENDHYYDYGMDFQLRIPEGFQVDAHRFSETFTAREFHELSLAEDFIFVCTKQAGHAAVAG